MKRSEKVHDINVKLVNLMMSKYGITYDDIISHLDESKQWLIDGKNWSDYYTLTNDEFINFKKEAIEIIRKGLRCSKDYAGKEFSWFYLYTGLSVE